MFLKRLLVGVLSGVIVFMNTAVCMPIAEDVNSYEMSEYKTLRELCLIEEKHKPQDNVTREAFAGVIARLIGKHTDEKATHSYFYDVDENGEYTSDINTLVELKFMSGYEGSNFRPENNISVNEMVSVLVTVAGYSHIAKMDGGYPWGYIKQLDRMGVDVSLSAFGDSVCFAQMAQLVYEVMNAPALDVGVVYTDGSTGFTKERTVLEAYLGIKQSTGIITATEQTAVYGDIYLAKGKIQIDDDVYSVDKDYCKLLGINAEFYSDEDNNIYYIKETDKNAVINLVSEYIKNDHDNEKITYIPEFGSRKSYRISDVCSFIYNGKFTSFDFSLLSGHDGNVRLLDNNGDGIYDVVFCDRYDVYIVNNISLERGIITDKFYSDKKLELNDEKIHYLKIFMDDIEIGIKDIQSGDVIYASESDGDSTSLTLVCSRQTEEGKIDEITGEYITVDGEKFYLSEYYKNAVENKKMPGLEVGGECVFALTPYGEIACVLVGNMLANTGYGYLYRVYENEESAQVCAVLLTSDGDWLEVDMADKVSVNSEPVKKEDVPTDSRFTKQLVRYRLNSNGKLKRIDFARLCEENNGYDVNEGDFRSRYSKTESREYKNTDKYFVKGGAVDFFVKDNTSVFVIPENRDNSSREDYYIAGTAYFKSGNSYKIQPFDETEYNVPAAVVVEEAENALMDRTNTSTNFVVVKGVTTTVIDDEVCEILKCYTDGAYNDTLVSKDMGIFVREDGTPLKKGDLIIANMNYFGKVNKIRVIKTAESRPVKEVEGSHSEEFQYVYGRVVRCGDGYMTVKNDSNTFRMVCNNPTVTVYDKEEGEIRSGDITELCPGDEVVVRNYVSRVREVVLYE